MKVRAVSRPLGCYWRKESGVKLRKLLRGGNLFDNGWRGGARIGRGQNGPANHQKIGARTNGFRRRRGARLIVWFGSGGFFRGPHSRSNDQKIAAAGFANRPRF